MVTWLEALLGGAATLGFIFGLPYLAERGRVHARWLWAKITGRPLRRPFPPPLISAEPRRVMYAHPDTIERLHAARSGRTITDATFAGIRVEANRFLPPDTAVVVELDKPVVAPYDWTADA